MVTILEEPSANCYHTVVSEVPHLFPILRAEQTTLSCRTSRQKLINVDFLMVTTVIFYFIPVIHGIMHNNNMNITELFINLCW